MNQLAIAGIGAVVIATGAFTAGWRVNSWRHDSQQLAIEQAAQKAGDAATAAATEAIKSIEVKNVTIRQSAETITREVPVFTECRAGERMLGLVNEALAAPGAAAGGVPSAGATDR